MPNTSMQTLRRKLTAQRAIGEKWRVIGLDYPGVAYGTLSRIVNDADYEPKGKAIRQSLGLTRQYAPHPVKRLTAIRKLLQNTYYKDS